jgi:hypothetical protein
MTNTTNPNRPPMMPRRRSRVVRRIVITLAVLLGLLVIADFAAAAVFENEVSKRTRAQFDLADDPSVKVGGFSFLIQAVSGEYDHVTVDARGVPVQNTLRDVEVHADLYDVRAPLGDLLSGSTQNVTIREVEGQVRIKASDVTRAITEQENEVFRTLTRLTIDPVSEQVAETEPPEGQEPEPIEEPEDTTAGARICATADIAGQSTDLCVFGIISLAEQRISFAPKRLDIRNDLTSGSLPPALERAVLDRFTITLDPGALPFEVTPTAVKVEPGTLSVKGKANEVALSGVGG